MQHTYLQGLKMKLVVLANILSEVKKAKYFSVLADEVSSHNVEHYVFVLSMMLVTFEKH